MAQVGRRLFSRASLSVCQAKRPELISIREQNEVVHPMRSVLDALQGARPLANLSSHHRGLPVQHIPMTSILYLNQFSPILKHL